MDLDATGSLAGALFGLDGFVLLAAADAGGELEIMVETTADLVPCPECGAVARAKDRRPSWVRDLPVAGRPVVICWVKRVWACPHQLCPVRTWTETHQAIPARSSLTARAAGWAVAEVGERDGVVSHTAAELGVGWHVVMRQVIAQGAPLVEDPGRLDDVEALGLDETAMLKATATSSTRFVTGITDLTPGRPARLLEVIDDHAAAGLRAWLDEREQHWRDQIRHAALDPYRGYASALTASLPDAIRVLDPFHVVRLGLSCLDEVRRRVQQETTGHRGRRGDPLYRARRRLRRRSDRLSDYARARLIAELTAGDPDGEVTLAWAIAQDLMNLYTQPDPAAAHAAAEKLITALPDCPIPEIARLGRTLAAWRTELLASLAGHGITNGPTENLNLKIKNTKRKARGYRNFRNYRLRLLLNHGRIRQDQPVSRIRTRRPRFVA